MNVLSEAPTPLTHLDVRAPHPACRACIIVPARNEEESLPGTLNALFLQHDLDGNLLDTNTFEVLLLLNNCTDSSAAAASAFQAEHPNMHLHVTEVSLPACDAHVGTARRMLMDAACSRLELLAPAPLAILSTDADTQVAPDWVARNLLHIEAGAEVVGGVINLAPGALEQLHPGIASAYQLDRRYQALVAELEFLLDPDIADPWPRHLQHFGASLACTPEIYRRSGGLPPIKPLEDVAFVNALRKVGARIRHAPDVHIYTSARLEGRAEIGLSGQLRHWQRDHTEDLPHLVDSAKWLAHRFASMSALRQAHRTRCLPPGLHLPDHWRQRTAELVKHDLPTEQFLEHLDCDALIEETFTGAVRTEIISEANSGLQSTITELRSSREHQA